MAKTKKQLAEQQRAIGYLQEQLTRGQTIYTHTDHTSQSGMSRDISCYVMQNNEPRDISYLVAPALGWPMGKKGGVRVGGCGMDMGFHLVYSLAGASFGEVDRAYPYTEEELAQVPKWCGPDVHFQRGGYALKQRWL